MRTNIKIGDLVKHKTLKGKVVNIFDTLAGKVLEIDCKAVSSSEVDTLLWVPESDLENQDA